MKTVLGVYIVIYNELYVIARLYRTSNGPIGLARPSLPFLHLPSDFGSGETETTEYSTYLECREKYIHMN